MASDWDELSGADDLEDCLDGDEGLEGIFDTIGKIAKGAVSAVGSVASFVPGIGTAISAGASLLGGVMGGGSKKPSVSPAQLLKGTLAQLKPKIDAAKAAGQWGKTDEERAANKKASATSGAAVVAAKRKTVAAGPAGTAAAPPTVVVQAAPLDTSAVVRAFSASVSPQLQTLAKSVQFMNLQAQATSEHRGKRDNEAFKRAVIQRLRDISAKR